MEYYCSYCKGVIRWGNYVKIGNCYYHIGCFHLIDNVDDYDTDNVGINSVEDNNE
jgi:hypothetical protein